MDLPKSLNEGKESLVPEDLVDLQRAIAEVDNNFDLTIAIKAIAPHTHEADQGWEKGFLVESWDGEEYVFNISNEANIEDNLIGIAFLIVEGKLVPYEFADSSVAFDELEYEMVLNTMTQLAAAVKNSSYGLLIDHWFKKSLFDTSLATMEYAYSPQGCKVKRYTGGNRPPVYQNGSTGENAVYTLFNPKLYLRAWVKRLFKF